MILVSPPVRNLRSPSRRHDGITIDPSKSPTWETCYLAPPMARRPGDPPFEPAPAPERRHGSLPPPALPPPPKAAPRKPPRAPSRHPAPEAAPAGASHYAPPHAPPVPHKPPTDPVLPDVSHDISDETDLLEEASLDVAPAE